MLSIKKPWIPTDDWKKFEQLKVNYAVEKGKLLN